MDKYEYKLRTDEIKALIGEKKYTEAMAIADTIDWTRVKSVLMLTTISDLYKINRKYDISRDLLLLAYDRHPSGRTIVYSLCELSIKMEDFVQAVEYYKEFVQIAPKDTGRYILQYKLYEAQEVSLEERISVLEEFKKRDYREKWAYELAYLYHRIGFSSKCVEECDEIFLWFGEGKYVTKAMELKLLHEPLSPSQQERYNSRNKKKVVPMSNRMPSEPVDVQDALTSSTLEIPSKELEFKVKTFDADNQFNTINIQQELAASMKDLMINHEQESMPATESELQEDRLQDEVAEDTQELMDSEELLENNEENSEEFYEDEDEAVTNAIIAPMMEHTAELPDLSEIKKEMPLVESLDELGSKNDQGIHLSEIKTVEEAKVHNSKVAEAEQQSLFQDGKSGFEDILSQEYDGQISLVVPDAEKVEKQITGQISIEDILVEWERMKKDLEQKRVQDVKARVLQQTGDMFSQFDAATKTDVLAQLEKAALIQEANERASRMNVVPVVEEETLEECDLEEDDLSQEELSEVEYLADCVLEEEMEDEYPPVEELEEVSEGPVSEESMDFVGETAFNTTDMEDVAEKLMEVAEKEVLGDKGFGKKAIATRDLTDDEKELFGAIIETKDMKEQIAAAMDSISLASYTGNIIVTGEEGAGTLTLAKNLIKGFQLSDSNFSGKVARITGVALNAKNIPATLNKLKNGALIVEKANGLTAESAKELSKYLEQEDKGIVVVLEDTKAEMRKLLKKNCSMTSNFNARIDIAEMNNDALVEYGRDYAYEQEFSIDELGVLALHTRIADMQTGDHCVTLAEVRDIVDEAIWSANRKNLKHLFDVLFAKRYDQEDMIILRERDFIC